MSYSDKDKERSPEEQESINRQRGRRELNELKKQIKREEAEQLRKFGDSTTADARIRRDIKARADAALEQAEANFTEKYNPSQNKHDYESDILQRGVDQFKTPESTDGGTGDGSFQSILICSNNSLKQADVFMRGEPTSV